MSCWLTAGDPWGQPVRSGGSRTHLTWPGTRGNSGYDDGVRGLGRRFARITVLVCLHAVTWACSSRPVATVPVLREPGKPSDLPSTVAVAPTLSSTAPALTPLRADTEPDECALLTAPGEPIAIVGLTDRINSANAPHPSNEGERLLFRQLYETLIRVDCLGRAVPGLAESWRLDADGRTWIVTLREDARFSDGTPLTADDVRAGWTHDGIGDVLRPDIRRLVQSIVAVGDRELAVVLERHRADAPLALAHQDLAIARRTAASLWPLGTRLGWTAADEPRQGRAASTVTLTRASLPSIRLLIAPGDPRDLLDQDIDLLLTRDPVALDYAATLPQFQSVPLAWQQTRVLLTPGRSRSSPSLSPEARQVLANDAVRGEARGAEGPFWWQTLSDCDVPPPPPRSQSSPIPRVVYDVSDAAARDLAERLVGLARASGPAARVFLESLLPDRPGRIYQRATGLPDEALAVARRRGADAAYVVSVDSRPVEPCRELQAMMDGAPWLDPETIVPLVDTRFRAIARRGRSGVTVDWDGGLIIAGANAPR